MIGRFSRGLIIAVLTLLPGLLLNPNTGSTEETNAEPKVKFTGGITGWLFSQGQTKWSHEFSQLTYKDNSTNIIELSGQATFLERWFIRGDFGYGTIGNGTLVDDDFSSANGPLESSTTSNITGNNLWYVNGDFGARLFHFPKNRGSMGFFTGIQYWRQQYQATGVVQTFCNPDPSAPLCSPANNGQNFAPNQTAITDTSTWISWRLGVEGDYRVTRRFGLEAKLVFIPVSSLNNEDVHHLRAQPGPTLPALQQNPSFRMTGTGIGANADVGANYSITARLSINLGYRLWWNSVKNGDVTVYPVGAQPLTINLKEFQTYRHGVILGLRYIF